MLGAPRGSSLNKKQARAVEAVPRNSAVGTMENGSLAGSHFFDVNNRRLLCNHSEFSYNAFGIWIPKKEEDMPWIETV